MQSLKRMAGFPVFLFYIFSDKNENRKIYDKNCKTTTNQIYIIHNKPLPSTKKHLPHPLKIFQSIQIQIKSK